MTLLYLHGFNSAAASHKAQVLQAHMDRLGFGAQFLAPDLPHRPAQSIALLETIITQAPIKPTLVGSSLGGYYATYLAERHDLKAVLINLAVAPYRLLEPLLGPQQNFYTGETYELTAQHLQELQALEIAPCIPSVICCWCRPATRCWIIARPAWCGWRRNIAATPLI